MKLTKRENILLYVALIFMLLYIFIRFLIQPVISENMQIKNQLIETRTNYNDIKMTIEQSQGTESEKQTYNKKIEKASNIFYKFMKNHEIDAFLTAQILKYNLTPNRLEMSEPAVFDVLPYAESVLLKQDEVKQQNEEKNEEQNNQKTQQSHIIEDDELITQQYIYCTNVDLSISGNEENANQFLDFLAGDKSVILNGLKITNNPDGIHLYDISITLFMYKIKEGEKLG